MDQMVTLLLFMPDDGSAGGGFGDRFLEDLTLGETIVAGPVEVTEEDIIAFARLFDPQPFHLSAQEAEKTLFRGLSASGWHTAAITMRLLLAARPGFAAGMIGKQIERLEWLKPVQPGDRLSVEAVVQKVTPARQGRSMGEVHTESATRNQTGETVLAMTSVLLVPSRDGTARP